MHGVLEGMLERRVVNAVAAHPAAARVRRMLGQLGLWEEPEPGPQGPGAQASALVRATQSEA